MVYSFIFCSITPNIWRAQKSIVSIDEKKNVNEERIAHWNIVNLFFNK